MSLLGNQNNDFEKKLKKHLGDTEYKPAESLWDRIDKEVNKPEFEQRVEGKIGRYELAPKPETWEYIEANLPPEPKSWKRSGKLWYGIVALLLISGAIIGYQLNRSFNQEEDALVYQHGTDMAETGNEMPERIQEAEQLKQIQSKPATNGLNNERKQEVLVEQKGTVKPETITDVASSPVKVRTGDNTKPQTPGKNTVNTLPASAQPLTKGNTVVAGGTKTDQGSVSDTENARPVAALEKETRPLNTNIAALDHGRNTLNNNTVAQSNTLLGRKENPENAAEKAHPNEPQPQKDDLVTPEPDKSLSPGNEPDATLAPDTSQPVPAKNTGKPVAQANDSVNGLPFNAIDDQPPVRLSITVLTGIHQSNMKLVAPSNMQANKAMRERVETPEWDFTGGFLLDYKVNEQVLISSGLILTSFSMGMSYNALPSNRSARLEPGATYENSRDSIVSGSNLSSRIKYSWNEIPLFVTYRFKTSKRVGVELRGGISYAMISTVDAGMVGQDNIGVLVMKTKESFPVLQNSIFTHLYAGISYKLNETVSLNAMPYVRYSLNSMIRNEKWIQQHPWMMGLSMGLRKSF